MTEREFQSDFHRCHPRCGPALRREAEERMREKRVDPTCDADENFGELHQSQQIMYLTMGTQWVQIVMKRFVSCFVDNCVANPHETDELHVFR